MSRILLDGRSLSLQDLRSFLKNGDEVDLRPEAWTAVGRCRDFVESICGSDRTVYGVNTGFGRLCSEKISADQAAQLQINLLRSHAVGLGAPLGEDEVRAALLLRINTLACGFSGIKARTLRLLLGMLNRGVTPVVPSQGSVGASGDLAPLAHVALVAIGEGRARFEGDELPGAEALRRARLEPLLLAEKEGLALINGTQFSTGVTAVGLIRANNLARVADIACALSADVLLGTDVAFQERLHRLRPHPGQLISASNLVALLAESPLRLSHRDCGRVQDAYALRCSPQVHGASRDALSYVQSVVEREMSSVTDNPILFPDDGDVVSGGNFHAEPVAMAADVLAIACAELASISERRLERLVNPDLSNGLPPFLTPAPGINSGLMMVQVTAAALVSENKGLCHPASVDSIPTSGNTEDHVSMGMWAARKAQQVVQNVERVLAIELLAGFFGLCFREPRTTPVLEKICARIAAEVAPPSEDRPWHKDIEAVVRMLVEGDFVGTAEDEIEGFG